MTSDKVKLKDGEPPKIEKTLITIEVIRTPGQGIDCRLAENCMLPPNDVLIRGIFDKAKDLALGYLFSEQQKELENKPKILLPGNPMTNGLKENFKKIFKGK